MNKKRLQYEVQSINDKLYEIIWEFKQENVKDVQGLKYHLGCDSAFKRNPTRTYIFCNEIKEVEYDELD